MRREIHVCDEPGCEAPLLKAGDGFVFKGEVVDPNGQTLVAQPLPETALCVRCFLRKMGVVAQPHVPTFTPPMIIPNSGTWPFSTPPTIYPLEPITIQPPLWSPTINPPIGARPFWVGPDYRTITTSSSGLMTQTSEEPPVYSISSSTISV